MGDVLRGLRVSRELSLRAAALRAELSPTTLSGWEAGHHVPRGPALDRLLTALGADNRLRARLIAACDPAHAQLALVRTSLGPPVSLGAVLRAMRERRGLAQAEVARAAGVTQAAVARWEAGDDCPDPATLHAVLFALRAAPEEVAAVTATSGGGVIGLPDDPQEAAIEIATHHPPPELREIVAMGFEAELWRRASRDARWDSLLGERIGQRANRLVGEGRFQEAETAARRALRLATTPEGRIFGVAAFGTLLNLARFGDADPGAILCRVEAWMDRLPTPGDGGSWSWMHDNYWSWMHMERGLCLAETGRLEAAEAAMERAAESIGEGTPDNERRHHRAVWLTEARLRAGQPRRALDLQSGLTPSHIDHWLLLAKAHHANGLVAPESCLESIRMAIRRPENDTWLKREAAAKVERTQARLAA